MRTATVQRIVAAYGQANARTMPAQAGYRNLTFRIMQPDKRDHNLIIYKREPGMLTRIKNANYMANFLAAHGLPVRQTADPRIMRVRPGQYAGLYTYLPGATIPWEAYTMAHLKLVGGTMSDMHRILRNLDRGGLPSVTDEHLDILGRMQGYFDDTGVRSALRTKLGLTCALPDYADLLRTCASLPNQQPLHMDFVRGNILFAETPRLHISGILDFEKTGWGSPLLDVARTLAFLLVDCKYKPAQKIQKYFLYSGYNKRGKARLQDVRYRDGSMLAQLTWLFLTYDFYKFLRHNPYESLAQNEHYIRTRDLLLKRNIIARSQMLK